MKRHCLDIINTRQGHQGQKKASIRMSVIKGKERKSIENMSPLSYEGDERPDYLRYREG